MIKRICKVLVFAFISLQITSGCTAIGLGTGVFLDSRKEPDKINPLLDLDTIKKGEKITVSLKGGEEYQGEYNGLGVVDEDKYLISYEQLRQNLTDGLQLPAIGDTITIYLKPARTNIHKERVFWGLDFEDNPDGLDAFLKLKYKISNKIETVKLSRIHSIVKPDKYEIDPQAVSDFIDSGGLMGVMAINLESSSGNNRIAINDIDYITLTSRHNMTKLLGAAGFVSDFLIFLLIKPTSDLGSGNTSGGG